MSDKENTKQNEDGLQKKSAEGIQAPQWLIQTANSGSEKPAQRV